MSHSSPIRIKLISFSSEFIDDFILWRHQPLSLLHNPLEPKSREELSTMLANELSDLSNLSAQFRYRWFIEFEGQPVGNVSLKNINLMMMTGEIAYGLGPKHQGKGIAQQAVRMVIEKIFKETPIRKVIAFVHDKNIPSARLLLKLGFQQEGILRDHYLIQGKPANEIVFGLLKTEFQTRKTINPFLKYVVFLDTIEGVRATESQIRSHIEYLRTLEHNGKLHLAGPFEDHKGGMLILNVSTYEEALSIAQSDPFILNKVRSLSIRGWSISCEANNHLGRG